jgi:hypothetical protein
MEASFPHLQVPTTCPYPKPDQSSPCPPPGNPTSWRSIHSCKIQHSKSSLVFILAQRPPSGPESPHSRVFLDHTQRRTTIGRNPLDGWSVRRRELYLTTHNTHNRQPSIPPVGFEPTISAGERPQTYVVDWAATGTGKVSLTGRCFLEDRCYNTGIRSLSTDINFCSYS